MVLGWLLRTNRTGTTFKCWPHDCSGYCVWQPTLRDANNEAPLHEAPSLEAPFRGCLSLFSPLSAGCNSNLSAVGCRDNGCGLTADRLPRSPSSMRSTAAGSAWIGIRTCWARNTVDRNIVLTFFCGVLDWSGSFSTSSYIITESKRLLPEKVLTRRQPAGFKKMSSPILNFSLNSCTNNNKPNQQANLLTVKTTRFPSRQSRIVVDGKRLWILSYWCGKRLSLYSRWSVSDWLVLGTPLLPPGMPSIVWKYVGYSTFSLV